MDNTQDQTTPRHKMKYLAVSTGAAAGGLWSYLNIESIHALLSDAWQLEVVKYTMAFTIAAWLHRNWVRKDMSEQFTKVAEAINNVAATLSQDLAAQANRLVNVEDSVGKLSGRVEALETRTTRRKKHEGTT